MRWRCIRCSISSTSNSADSAAESRCTGSGVCRCDGCCRGRCAATSAPRVVGWRLHRDGERLRVRIIRTRRWLCCAADRRTERGRVLLLLLLLLLVMWGWRMSLLLLLLLLRLRRLPGCLRWLLRMRVVRRVIRPRRRRKRRRRVSWRVIPKPRKLRARRRCAWGHAGAAAGPERCEFGRM